MTDCANILKNYVYLCVESDNTYKTSLDANDLIQWKKRSRCSNISFPTKSITIDLVQLDTSSQICSDIFTSTIVEDRHIKNVNWRDNS
jgi:hypothetical protein